MIAAFQMLCSLILGLTFAWSAAPKLRQPDRFVLAVYEYRVLPPALVPVYARAVPVAEFLVAVLFLSGTAVRLAAIVAGALLTSFLFGVTINLSRGRRLNCNCFGQSRRKIGWKVVGEDVGLILLSAAVVRAPGNWIGLEEWSVARPISGGGIVALTLLAFLASAGIAWLMNGSHPRADKVVVRKEGSVGTVKYSVCDQFTRERRTF